MGKKDVSILQYGNDEMNNELDMYLNVGNVDIELKRKYKRIYKRWYDIHYRCYSEKLHERAPTYIGCSVCEEWHDFGNFLNWYQDNYYEVKIDDKKITLDLDKDILSKGNKIYCPEYCVLVPHEINTMFINGKNKRGEYPVGVSWDNSRNSFRAQVTSKKLGRFKTAKEAFVAYKHEKEKQIKELARKYKGQIPDRLYEAMIHWKIEITD